MNRQAARKHCLRLFPSVMPAQRTMSNSTTANGPGGDNLAILWARKKIEALEEKRQQLEESLASKSAEFAKARATSAVTLKELSSALPQNSVYIDFVDYRKFDYKKNKWG